MKILVINTCGLKVTGITIHMINYLKHICNAKTKVDVVSTISEQANMVHQLTEIGCHIIQLPNRKKELKKYIIELARVIKNGNYDVIHVHGNSATMSIELTLGELYGIKKRIAHCHNSRCNHPIINIILRPYFKSLYTDALACSKLAGDWLFGSNGYDILHNAIELKEFSYNETVRTNYRKKLNIIDEIVIGHIGSFNEQKNHEQLIDIFYEFQKKENAKLILVGTGEKEEEIYKKVKSLKIEEKVLFLGIREDVSSLMQVMDIFVFPSHWEGLGMVLIEAQAAGLPILASDVVPNEVKYMDNFYYEDLIKENRVWVEKIKELLEMKKERKINLEILKDYNIENTYLKLLKIYKSFLYTLNRSRD